MNLLEEGNDQLPEFEAGKNYVEELVGEGKKFKSIEDLAKGKLTSDSYIKVMERQQDELRQMYLKEREENIARAKIEDLLNQSRLTSNDNPVKEVSPPPVDIDSLLDKKLSERERERTAQDNFKTVQSKLREHYGNNYQEALKQQLQTLDLSLDYLNSLARTSPKALYSVLGIGDTKMINDPFRAPPKSTNTFSPTGEKKRTWQYYQDMKKTDPKRYASRETNIQIQKDYIADPQGFGDGDFDRY